MSYRAQVKDDQFLRGVEIRMANLAERSGDLDALLDFSEVNYVRRTEANREEPDVQPLRLPDDAARALYEALAEHYGHAGHDIRALRKDYEAERKRVDLFIARAVQ